MTLNSDFTEDYIQLSNYLDQGRLIEFHDLEGIRIGIRSLTPQETSSIFLSYKATPSSLAEKEAMAPLLFSRVFLYSIDGKELSKEEKEELSEVLHSDLLEGLFRKWEGLQERAENLGRNLEKYCETENSRIKYKICRMFQCLPSDPRITGMDPVTKAWFYLNILEDERDSANLMYDQGEYIVSFWDSKAAEAQRKARLKAQGIKVAADPNAYESTHFDQDLLADLKELDPDLDTTKIKTLDDYIRFTQEIPFEQELERNRNGSSYSEEDKANLLQRLELEKHAPLTDTEKEITIFKLENGQPINLKQIIDEAVDFDLGTQGSSQLESLPNLDDIR